MQPVTELFERWHDFYMLLGTASATMIGLLFVAASVGSGIFARSRRGAQRMFLSASVVHFGGVLAMSLLVLAPFSGWSGFGGFAIAGGLFGLAYCGLTWADVIRDGLTVRIDLEDRLWYALGPVIGYLTELGAGAGLMLRLRLGCPALAIAMGMLLLVAIHNAWDITIWSVTRDKP
jgi:hypothetical protein